MWRGRISLAALALALVAAPPAAAQHATTRDSLAIVRLEHEWLATRDSATLVRILAPDFEHPVPPGDVLTRAQHIHWDLTHPRPRGQKQRFASLTVRMYGSAAIANGVVVISDSTGRTVRRTLFTDVFVRRHGEWQAVNAQENNLPLARPERRRPERRHVRHVVPA